MHDVVRNVRGLMCNTELQLSLDATPFVTLYSSTDDACGCMPTTLEDLGDAGLSKTKPIV